VQLISVTSGIEGSISKWSGERSSETRMTITTSRQGKAEATAGWKEERRQRGERARRGWRIENSGEASTSSLLPRAAFEQKVVKG